MFQKSLILINITRPPTLTFMWCNSISFRKKTKKYCLDTLFITKVFLFLHKKRGEKGGDDFFKGVSCANFNGKCVTEIQFKHHHLRKCQKISGKSHVKTTLYISEIQDMCLFTFNVENGS